MEHLLLKKSNTFFSVSISYILPLCISARKYCNSLQISKTQLGIEMTVVIKTNVRLLHYSTITTYNNTYIGYI